MQASVGRRKLQVQQFVIGLCVIGRKVLRLSVAVNVHELSRTCAVRVVGKTDRIFFPAAFLWGSPIHPRTHVHQQKKGHYKPQTKGSVRHYTRECTPREQEVRAIIIVYSCLGARCQSLRCREIRRGPFLGPDSCLHPTNTLSPPPRSPSPSSMPEIFTARSSLKASPRQSPGLGIAATEVLPAMAQAELVELPPPPPPERYDSLYALHSRQLLLYRHAIMAVSLIRLRNEVQGSCRRSPANLRTG